MLRDIVKSTRKLFIPKEKKSTRNNQFFEFPASNISYHTNSNWLEEHYTSLNYLGISDIEALDNYFINLRDDQQKIDFSKKIITFFSIYPEKLRLIASSEHYLLHYPNSIAIRIAYISANYILGHSFKCLHVAEQVAGDWQNSFTRILLARIKNDAKGFSAEHDELSRAVEDYPDDIILYFNLVENLISSNKVTEANEAIIPIKNIVEHDLADEIEVAKKNQALLETAISNELLFPEGEHDIYSDERCRNFWIAYYESYVTRRERQHGDRLLLNNFIKWVKSVENDLDVLLDFGCLCAQPLYEAAEMAPNIKFIGTDRQRFLAELNRDAYPLPNLSFDHGDIFDVMERAAQLPGRKALVHIRTTTTIYPAFVEKLYKNAARLGYHHIYLIENAGLLRTQLKFLCFETMKERAVITKHHLLLHNYREVLSHAGYDIQQWRRIQAPGLWRGEHASCYLGSQYEVHAKLR